MLGIQAAQRLRATRPVNFRTSTLADGLAYHATGTYEKEFDAVRPVRSKQGREGLQTNTCGRCPRRRTWDREGHGGEGVDEEGVRWAAGVART